MDKRQIIEELAKKGTVSQILQNIGCTGANAEDLSQDIFFSLLTKDEELIQRLYEKDELRYYITKIATNNFNSRTSPFYTTYKNNSTNYGLIEELIDKDRIDD